MSPEPLELELDLQQFTGKWVAIRSQKIIDAADTPYALVMKLHSRGIIDIHSGDPTPDVTIVRAPDVDEALLVGLG